MSDPETTVVVMAKPAIRGRVKTRLAEDLGADAAVEIYRCFLADMARQVGAFCEPSGRTAVLAHTGDAKHASYGAFDERGYRFVPQGDGGLGERLRRVTSGAFDRGAKWVIVTGTDSPTLGERLLENAVDALTAGGNDVVVGPAFDGGYYLIGLGKPVEAPFRDVDWSSRAVLRQTLARCRTADLVCDLLEFWYDVDTVSDLKFLRDHLLGFLSRRRDDIGRQTADWLENRGAAMLEDL